jgi:ABC-type Na+ efflux pump permease subunit
MTRLIRWLRGAVGIGLTWAGLWVAFGVVLVIGLRIFRPEDLDRGEAFGTILPVLGLVGFLSGIGFAGLLSMAERRRTLQDLSLGRVALWGLLGSAAIPLLMGTDGSMGWITGSLGATFAAASVAVARGGSLGPPTPRDLLE